MTFWAKKNSIQIPTAGTYRCALDKKRQFNAVAAIMVAPWPCGYRHTSRRPSCNLHISRRGAA